MFLTPLPYGGRLTRMTRIAHGTGNDAVLGRIERIEFADGSTQTRAESIAGLPALNQTGTASADRMTGTGQSDTLAGAGTKLKAMQYQLGTLGSEESAAFKAENNSHWAIAA